MRARLHLLHGRLRYNRLTFFDDDLVETRRLLELSQLYWDFSERDERSLDCALNR